MALPFIDQTVLHPSASANRAVYEDVRRKDPTMCEALRELMNDDIEKEIKERNREAVDASAIAMIKAVMENFGVDAAKAMNALRVPQADQLRYAAML